MNMEAKVIIYKTCIRSILTYSRETAAAAALKTHIDIFPNEKTAYKSRNENSVKHYDLNE